MLIILVKHLDKYIERRFIINQAARMKIHMIHHVLSMKKIDYDNFKILDKATANQMVLIKEMLYIDSLIN